MDYHVGIIFDNNMLNQYLDEGQSKEFGGNLSVNFPKNQKKLMIHGHDEMCLNQYCTCKRCWKLKGLETLRPRTRALA